MIQIEGIIVLKIKIYCNNSCDNNVFFVILRQIAEKQSLGINALHIYSILMESIRININKQLTGEGLLPIISYPSEAAYDFRIHNCASDMANLGASRAYELRVYPDGRNLQLSLIDTIEGGFIQYAILLDSSRMMVPADHLVKALRELSKTYLSLAARDDKPSTNKPFINAVADIRSKLALDTKAGLPRLLPTPDKEHEPITYFMNFRGDGQLTSLINYPDQEFFHHTPAIYLLAEGIQPAASSTIRRVEAIVMREFKILSPDGYEYGNVKEGDKVRINLRGKEGMLPMSIEVKGDVTKPTKYGYFDSAANCIRVDERTIKFYYELRFVVQLNGRMLRSCTVRYNGEQVMPDTIGSYLLRVYEDNLQNAGNIQFTGNNLKDAVIPVTPGMVKQGEYVFIPEPKHDLTRVTLDFNDGHPIKTTFDIGTNDRLFNQLERGKVKGYKVKREGDDFRIFLPRKLSATSKNILRVMKALLMVAATLICYALACHVATNRWPWPMQNTTTTVAGSSDVDGLDTYPDSAALADDDEGIVVDETDQVVLEQSDQAYLRNNNMWRKDSIRSSKYTAIINTIFSGRVSDIRMRGYNGKVIPNNWWEQIWRNFIMQGSVDQNVAKNVFEAVGGDNVSLDLIKLYEELSKKVGPSPDGLKSTFPSAAHHNQVVPGTPPPAEQAPSRGTSNAQQAAPGAQGGKPTTSTPQGVQAQ